MKFNVGSNIALMDFLLSQNLKRNDIKNYLKYKSIYVNGDNSIKFNHELKKGDIVEISKEKRKTSLDIIYEDEEFIVINKPCGLLSERTAKEEYKTAFNYVREYLKLKHENVYLVHRLDQYTSGVLMFVKSKKLYDLMTHNWNDLIKKRGYIALVEGRVEDKEGVIKTYLYESKSQLVKVSFTEGKEAITEYKVIRCDNQYSKLEINLKTGRKNQIRVHMNHIGHPVIGDDKYGSGRLSPIKRLGLHANKLEFIHPVTKKKYLFEADIPSSFDLWKKNK